MTEQYWFFTAYFAMFIVSPMLNSFVNKADSRMLKIFLLVMMLLGVLSCVWDPFYLDSGYSFAWFCQLYIIGATIKKYKIPQRFSKRFWGWCVLSAFLITWLPKILFKLVNVNIFNIPFEKIGSLLISYCSPTIIIMAIGFVCIFERIKINKFAKTIIRFLSPATFSVYLIHDNNYVRGIFMLNRFVFVNDYNPLLMVLMVILCALAIFVTCVFIDKIRALFFNILRIDKLAEKIESVIRLVIKSILHLSDKVFEICQK